MTISYSVAVKNAKNDVVETTIGTAPVLRVYSGSVPANADASIGAATLLAQGSLPSDWLGASASGVKSKAGTWTITGQSGAGAGTAGTFYRIWDTAGTTCGEQGSFSATGGGGDMTADNNNIANAQVWTISSYAKTAGN
jgi:hypothetical protein